MENGREWRGGKRRRVKEFYPRKNTKGHEKRRREAENLQAGWTGLPVADIVGGAVNAVGAGGPDIVALGVANAGIAVVVGGFPRVEGDGATF
jgi:hypothetical protein